MKEKIQDYNNKKILIISIWGSLWSLGEGAGVSDDYYFVKKATSRGFALHFLAPRTKKKPDLLHTSHFVHHYPDFFGATNWLPSLVKRIVWPILFQFIVLPRAVFAARRIRPDLILGHSHYATLAARISSRLIGVPSAIKLFGVMDLVHMEWNRPKYYYKNLEQILSLRIPQDAWFILDDGTRGKEAAEKLGLGGDRIYFLPNGINTEWAEFSYDRTKSRLEANLPRDVPVVLFLSRLVKSKRPMDLITAVPHILGNGRHRPFFLFVGDGPMRERCEILARRLGVTSSLRFEGAVSHDQVPRIMAASDIFVSISSLTNMAIPTCEALVCGLPVVAYDVGDTGRVVKHNQTGMLVADGDIRGLCDAITRLLDNPDDRKRMGQYARVFAKENFIDWDKRTNIEMDIILSIINKSRKRNNHPAQEWP